MDKIRLLRQPTCPGAVCVAILALVWSFWAHGFEIDYGPGPAWAYPAKSAGEMRQGSPTADPPLGDWGISARYRSRSLNTEFNLYWAESQERRLQSPPGSGAAVPPAVFMGDESARAYPEGVRVLGAGFQTSIRRGSVGSDVELSRNTAFTGAPLDSVPGTGADPQDKLNYVASQLVRVRLTGAYSLPATALWDSATVRLNVGRQRLNSVSRNAVAIDPGGNRHSRSVQLVFTPGWSEILPNLDLSLPLSLSYSPKAQAPLPGVDRTYKGFKLSVGASAVYQKSWNADVSFIRYFQDAASSSSPPSRDRNFVWVSIQRSF